MWLGAGAQPWSLAIALITTLSISRIKTAFMAAVYLRWISRWTIVYDCLRQTMIPLVIFLHQSNPLNQVVEFHEPPTMLRAQVARLAAKVKVKLEVSPAVPDSGIYIASKDLTLQNIMDSVAEVTFGEWSLDRGTYYLRRSDAKVRKGDAAERAEFKERIDKLFANCHSAWEAPELTPQEARVKAEINSKPRKYDTPEWNQMVQTGINSNAIGRVLLRVGSQALSQCPDGGRIVFSSQPTQAQYALPQVDFVALFQRLRREQQVAMQDGLSEFGNGNAMMNSVQPGDQGVDMLAVSRNLRNHDTRFTISRFNGKGTWDFSMDFRLAREALSPKLEGTHKFIATPEATALYRTILKSSKEAHCPDLRPYMDIATHEPLAIADGFMKAWTERDGPNFVSVVPDLLIFADAFDMRSENIVENSLGRLIRECGTLVFNDIGKARVCRTQTLDTLGRMNADRVQVKQLFDQVLSDTPEGDQALVEYIARHPGVSMNDLGVSWASLYTKHQFMHESNNVVASALYYNLSKPQRELIARGKTLTWPQLPRAAKEQLLKDIYLRPSTLELASSDPGNNNHESGNFPFLEYLVEEPTQSFSVAPSMANITARPFDEIMICRYSGPVVTKFAQSSGTLRSIAREEVAVKRGSSFAQDCPYYLPMRASRLHITIQLEHGLVITGNIQTGLKYLTEKPVLRDKLPKDILAALAVETKKAEEQMSQMHYGTSRPQPAKP